MGSFYSNIVVAGAGRMAVLEAVSAPALIGPTADGVTVVFPPDDQSGVEHVGASLAATLDAAVLVCTVHDDDILSVTLWRGAEMLYTHSVPDPAEYFGEGDFDLDPETAAALGLKTPAPAADASDRAQDLVAGIGRGDAAAVEVAMAADFVLASERHGLLMQALQLPDHGVNWGYEYLQSDRSGYDGPELTAL